MNIKDIPFIIPNFNQLTYLRGLINQIRFYYPDNWIYVIDNGSNYEPLKKYYRQLNADTDFSGEVLSFPANDFIGNLNHFLIDPVNHFDYYVISDPDLSIHPATPPNFLEIFKTAIDVYGFHHAGFGLRVDDLPPWNPKAGWIRGDELALLNSRATQIEHEGVGYAGFKAPIDTTFALYKRDNGGWSAPMSGEAWGNCIRLFELQHLPWYLSKEHLNDEMKNYFATCLKRDDSKPSAGRNHYAPE